MEETAADRVWFGVCAVPSLNLLFAADSNEVEVCAGVWNAELRFVAAAQGILGCGYDDGLHQGPSHAILWAKNWFFILAAEPCQVSLFLLVRRLWPEVTAASSCVGRFVCTLIALDVAVAFDPWCVEGHSLADCLKLSPKFFREEDMVLWDFQT